MYILKKKTMEQKLIFVFMYTSIIVLGGHVVTYININHTISKFDSVYASNLKLTKLSESLENVQENMYEYLSIKSSESLEAYYVSVQDVETAMKELNDKIYDNSSLLMEKNIKNMTGGYLEATAEAVQAKRGRNIKKYNENYNKANNIYEFINTYINSLNDNQFKRNSNEYLALRKMLKHVEMVSTLTLVSIILFNTFIITLFTKRITAPLMRLSKSANEIAMGNLESELVEIKTDDEIEILSKAFNKMVISIRKYIEKLKQTMAEAAQMKEKELIMENRLKDAQLKYLQAQINPHFLFNSLNAGMQLAMIEDAEQTSIFIENMAEFFRYNITKINQETTLKEEIKLVDHYIYILNVRFLGEINYRKEIDDALIHIKVPSMILQPIVENVYKYGVRDIEWEGKTILSVYRQADRACICIEDNGRGMSKEKIAEIMQGKRITHDKEENKESNNIGLANVMERLRLYYDIEGVLNIESEGVNKGTKVIISIPIKEELVSISR